eukprot:c12022_g1_i1.p2 GENE.c12022_g1_i1~~c12022_g1_i1.p2  ORF type:complete len:104 (+),score=21.39 c12022_g1_i1:495-806(+)
MWEVVVMEACFSTPRITMHMCLASITTPTPRGSRSSWIAFAISLHNRSWIYVKNERRGKKMSFCISKRRELGFPHVSTSILETSQHHTSHHAAHHTSHHAAHT